MKRHGALYGLLCALLMLGGCTLDGVEEDTPDACAVRFCIGAEDARHISPAYSEEDYSYVLTYYATDGSTETLHKTWMKYASMVEEDLYLAEATYTFTLEVYCSGRVILRQTLENYPVPTADGKVYFNDLELVVDDTMHGSVRVALGLPSDSGVVRVAAKLSALSGWMYEPPERDLDILSGADGTCSVVYAEDFVDNGTYLLIFTLYQADGSTDTYAETVTVAPGVESSGTRSLEHVSRVYGVTFSANGGSGSMAAQYFAYGSRTDALTANSFTHEPYSFTGWNTESDGSGTAYADGASFTASGDVTLYAQWAVTYTITFYANYDGDGGVCVTRTFAYDADNTLYTGMSRAGYRLTGWNTAADGSGTQYEDEASITGFVSGISYQPGTGFAGSLYAQWEQKTNVSVDVVSDTVSLACSAAGASVKAGEAVTFTATVDKRSGGTVAEYTQYTWWLDGVSVEASGTEIISGTAGKASYSGNVLTVDTAGWPAGTYHLGVAVSNSAAIYLTDSATLTVR